MFCGSAFSSLSSLVFCQMTGLRNPTFPPPCIFSSPFHLSIRTLCQLILSLRQLNDGSIDPVFLLTSLHVSKPPYTTGSYHLQNTHRPSFLLDKNTLTNPSKSLHFKYEQSLIPDLRNIIRLILTFCHFMAAIAHYICLQRIYTKWTS